MCPYSNGKFKDGQLKLRNSPTLRTACRPTLKAQPLSLFHPKGTQQFWGLVHGIWPRLKRDRRRDGHSLFGPPGQLAKREQPGTGNEEERRRKCPKSLKILSQFPY
ncbi:hypothetical protein DUI87_19298 [Hirundo rustica rustica]|uniref:Uncharacterized protein n=1 Tax=Hirundo rustica rustica TaxID=333673 RepID=A0A3M0JUU6_HIRRU|nr:hypothetical protein DUI87_19298 [Hirundo rustica rustica]